MGRWGGIRPGEADLLGGGRGGPARGVQADPACLEMDAEDVHSFVETRLTEAVGDLAGQAHLGRSRNEQSVTGLRLWLRRTTDRLRDGVARLVEALVAQGQSGADPGSA